MTDQDTLIAVTAAALTIWWLWEHPEAAKVLGFVLLLGLVGFGVAHASQTRAQRHHRTGYRQGHHPRRRGQYYH
jgi:drug/metabolite transporter (DMT)-like permease